MGIIIHPLYLFLLCYEPYKGRDEETTSSSEQYSNKADALEKSWLLHRNLLYEVTDSLPEKRSAREMALACYYFSEGSFFFFLIVAKYIESSPS